MTEYEFVFEVELGDAADGHMRMIGDSAMDALLAFKEVVDPIVSSERNTLVLEGALFAATRAEAQEVIEAAVLGALNAADVELIGGLRYNDDRSAFSVGSLTVSQLSPA